MRSVQCCTRWLVLVTVSVCVKSQRVRVQWCMAQKRERGGETGESWASWQPDVWSCPSVCWSWPGDSAVSSLMAADWRSYVMGGWDHLLCRGLCGWDGSWREGRETQTIFSSCSHYPLKGLVAGRVAGSECSRWCLCKRCTWWGAGALALLSLRRK